MSAYTWPTYPLTGASGFEASARTALETYRINGVAMEVRLNNFDLGTGFTDGTINGSKLVNASVTGAKLTDNSVGGAKLTDASVTGAKMTDNSVDGAKLTDATVGAGKLDVAGTRTDSYLMRWNETAGKLEWVPSDASGDTYMVKNDAGDLSPGFLDTKVRLTDNVTVTVGSGGQYSTINEALAYLTARYPIYKSGGGITATISLLTGFVMAEQVIVQGLNLGWIAITSVDATVTITRSALTVAIAGMYPAFAATGGGTLPVISALFSMDTSGTSGSRVGVYTIGAGSSATITANKGVINAGSYGIYAVSGSTINAYGANASAAGSYGICATDGSTINASGANASAAGSTGIYAAAGSTINAFGANASAAGSIGIYAVSGSTISAFGANASAAGSYGICATAGSTISANSANAQRGGTPAVTDFVVSTGSVITKHSGTGGVSQTINTLTTNGIIYG